MFTDGTLEPSQLSRKDLPWQIAWDHDKCSLCGRCSAVCPVRALAPGVFRRRVVQDGFGLHSAPVNAYQVFYGIRQQTDSSRACIGCGMCTLVCPNEAILPVHSDEADKLRFHSNRGGQPRRRGGRRNAPAGILDRIKFTRISMLTDPALDAGRHEFEFRTLLGRVLPPEDTLRLFKEKGWMPPVREIYPLIIGSMSFGALSPSMWEGLLMGVAYLNEEMNLPVRMCTGEGGCPPRLLRSRFLKYVILQIASGYFGWDEILHALPEMKEDPCAVEIKYGQGAKPGDGGLLMWNKVNRLIAAIRGVPQGVNLPSPPTHQTKYSIEEAVAKMVQSMYMAWGFRVPVYPKISGTSTSLAVLNNLTRNPYAAALIMLGASGVQIGKYIMQAGAGCLGSETDRCNVCNIGVCPKGITSQDPRVYRRLDPEKVAERVVDVYLSFDTELKKIMAPLGRSTSLPVGMSDGLGIDDYHAAQRLRITYCV